MKSVAVILGLLLCLSTGVFAQTEWIATWIQPRDAVYIDTFECWASIPANYNPAAPPAILVWWHHLAEDYLEMRDGTVLDQLANDRGWIAASFTGPNGHRHWNGWRGQEHCQRMLDSLYQLYPFCRDSIYMIGGSMGGAAGQVWHNNNCGIHDYMAAATVGGSQILDCQLRWEQQAAALDTNRSMTRIMGGYPFASDSIAYEYHRASAIHLADTLESMHFNSLHLPVYNVWGISALEELAYGEPATRWLALREAHGADCTFAANSGIDNHGLGVMDQDSCVRWLSGFRVNRFPDWISINADENDEYYWTRVELANANASFGRYGAVKNAATRRLDLTLIRNIARIDVECEFPWTVWDTLSGTWLNLDAASVPQVTVALRGVPAVALVRGPSGNPVTFTYADGMMSLVIGAGGQYTVIFEPAGVPEPRGIPLPAIRLASAYPNPFNGNITLQIESPLAATRALQIFDVTGRQVRSLIVGLVPGPNRISISATGLASGVYFARLDGMAGKPLKLALLR